MYYITTKLIHSFSLKLFNFIIIFRDSRSTYTEINIRLFNGNRSARWRIKNTIKLNAVADT